MNPSLAIPTDNIFKFCCLFGLALIITSVIAFVSTYNFSLANKVRYAETIILLEAKSPRGKADDDVLKLNKKLLSVTNDNANAANIVIGLLCGVGLALSGTGAASWYKQIQQRDDELVELQMEKLRLEISNLRTENRIIRKRRFSH